MSRIIRVEGRPAPQGSKRHVGNGRMIEQSKYVKDWRDAVKKAAEEQCHLVYRGAVEVHVTFFLNRPKTVLPTARTFPTVRPDLDKLVRSTMDALTDSGVWLDDAQVILLVARKRYVGTGFYESDEPQGAHIQIELGPLGDARTRGEGN